MKATRPTTPELQTEVANRLVDPFETAFQGIIRSNDPLLIERGEHGNPWALYRDLKRDGKIFSCLQKRKLALISRPWNVDPIEEGEAGQADAEIVSDILTNLQFDNLCSELLDALIVGFVPAEIVWDVQAGRIVPVRVLKRPQRRFVYVQTDANKPPELRLLTAANMLTGERLPERKFIVHRVNPEDDNPYGTGMGLQLFWAKFFKNKAILSWNKTNDRFGSPTPWGKHANNASPKEKATLFDALKAMSNDGVMMTPEGVSIELLESKLTGTIQTQKHLCEYMDRWISEVILSQEPSQSTGATASAASEREDVRLDIVQADADLLSDTLNSTLIKWICELNGLAPCTVSRDIKKPEDRLANSQTDANVAALGFKPSLEYIRERYGDGWEPATPPAAPAAPAAPTVLPAPASFAEPGLVAEDLDAIDALVDAELANWQPLIVPAQDALQRAIDQSIAAGECAAQLIARLPQLLGSLPVDALAQSLTHAAFTARLAAQAGIATK
jgi:phage gp29-like protein